MPSYTSFFTDAVLRAPTIGSMLMCFSAALIGVIVFLRKQSLIGEALSHATYPGIILGSLGAIGLSIGTDQEFELIAAIITGAFLSAMAGLWCIQWLEKKWKIHSDSALCFVLATFFGFGVTLASYLQFSYPIFYKQSQNYLYGQAATMTDYHIVVYAFLSFLIVLMLLSFYKEIQALIFDREYAKSLGIPVNWIDFCLFILIALALVTGIRAVGVVLMSAMLVIPAAAARQFTNKLFYMFILAGIIGLNSGYFGNYASIALTQYFSEKYPAARLSFPTGPMIVLVAATLCLLSLLFAPERGFLLRKLRIFAFQDRCLQENILKTMWRQSIDNKIAFSNILKTQNISSFYLWLSLRRLIWQGWISKVNGSYALTPDGQYRASQIVRLHRLWEVYLTDYLGMGAERVHHSAEEMEHIITPGLEKELTLLLNDPKQDPHHQPIPPKSLF